MLTQQQKKPAFAGFFIKQEFEAAIKLLLPVEVLLA